VLAILTVGTLVVGPFVTSSLTGQQSLWSRLVWIVAGIIIYFSYLWWQSRSQEATPEAIKERVSQLEPELRKQVQARSYGARRNLIEAPLRELDLDIMPRLGWVRDPRLIEPVSERIADDIVAAFESSKRRLLIVGEPGAGKTMAAYSLIEYLDETEGDERVALLVNLSAWEAQEDFEAFLVDYLCSSVGYEVRERAVASAFISSDRYDLILDGLDEIPAGLREHFSERLDEYVRGLPSEVGVVVTCRTQEYEQLLAAHFTGLGLVQAVQILPLTDQQLDSAFVELSQRDKDWETFLSQRHLTAYKRVRHLLSNPLFLNLAVVGHLSPEQLLDSTTTERDLRDLVLESYLDSILVADQRPYEPQDARRFLSWIARFLNGAEISPFGLKASDLTVFDLADLTPADPPRRYRLLGGLVVGLGIGLIFGLGGGLEFGKGLAPGSGLGFWLVAGLVFALVTGLVFALIFALIFALVWGPFKRSAVSSRLTLIWPSTRRQLLDFLRRAGRGLGLGLVVGLIFGLVFGLFIALATYSYINVEGEGPIPWFEVRGEALSLGQPIEGLGWGLGFGAVFGVGMGLVFGLVMGLGSGLLEARSVLITSRTPKEASSRSRTAALTWLASGLGGGLVVEQSVAKGFMGGEGLGSGLGLGLGLGLVFALRNGGWFVLLQRVAHRRLARAGNLPTRPYDFLEWGIEKQIFRRVGGGVRFRHNLIQQHLASTSD
jgi:adenylate kinase family enzyme